MPNFQLLLDQVVQLNADGLYPSAEYLVTSIHTTNTITILQTCLSSLVDPDDVISEHRLQGTFLLSAHNPGSAPHTAALEAFGDVMFNRKQYKRALVCCCAEPLESIDTD